MTIHEFDPSIVSIRRSAMFMPCSSSRDEEDEDGMAGCPSMSHRIVGAGLAGGVRHSSITEDPKGVSLGPLMLTLLGKSGFNNMSQIIRVIFEACVAWLSEQA